jgi:predicted MPP superfamily phosphohydrolase
MNRLMSFIIFIVIVSAVYFGLHYFVYKCLARSLVQADNARKIIKWFFWFSGSSFFIGLMLSRGLKIHILLFYSYTWLGVIAAAFFVFFLQWPAAKIFPAHSRLFAVIALCVTGIVSFYSLVNGLRMPEVKRIAIPMKKLPPQLSGFSIVQISDLHLEAYSSPKRLAYIVDTVNALKPDLIVITGDLIDGGDPGDAVFCHQLKRLASTHGVLAITGNHEFYAGIENFFQLASCANIKILRNESVVIAGNLQIIGLDDDTGKQFGSGGPDLDTPLKTCDTTQPVILLYHRPAGFDKAVEKGVDLQLSGHTHAGQIPPMDLLVWLYYKYPYGLYKRDGSFIYTTSGTGYWGPSMRFSSRCEIVRFRLISDGPERGALFEKTAPLTPHKSF